MGASDGVIHSSISHEVVSLRAATNSAVSNEAASGGAVASVVIKALVGTFGGVDCGMSVASMFSIAFHCAAVVIRRLRLCGLPKTCSPMPKIKGFSGLRTRTVGASQRSLHNAPIFRLLLKVAVNGTHQCDFHNF